MGLQESRCVCVFIICFFHFIYHTRFLHIQTQTKVDSRDDRSHTGVKGNQLEKIDSQESQLSSRSGSEEYHQEPKAKIGPLGLLRRKYEYFNVYSNWQLHVYIGKGETKGFIV